MTTSFMTRQNGMLMTKCVLSRLKFSAGSNDCKREMENARTDCHGVSRQVGIYLVLTTAHGYISQSVHEHVFWTFYVLSTIVNLRRICRH